jgi:hypothetical protein
MLRSAHVATKAYLLEAVPTLQPFWSLTEARQPGKPASSCAAPACLVQTKNHNSQIQYSTYYMKR